ncbi:MAG: hypothetical protein KDD55_00175 [Bdellovibrionales bacterium]|nr:hypothetical protein [Bdellovibrionales bacterium]
MDLLKACLASSVVMLSIAFPGVALGVDSDTPEGSNSSLLTCLSSFEGKTPEQAEARAMRWHDLVCKDKCYPEAGEAEIYEMEIVSNDRGGWTVSEGSATICRCFRDY